MLPARWPSWRPVVRCHARLPVPGSRGRLGARMPFSGPPGANGARSNPVCCSAPNFDPMDSTDPGFPRWMTNLMTCFADSAIRINAIPSALRANPMSPGG